MKYSSKQAFFSRNTKMIFGQTLRDEISRHLLGENLYLKFRYFQLIGKMGCDDKEMVARYTRHVVEKIHPFNLIEKYLNTLENHFNAIITNPDIFNIDIEQIDSFVEVMTAKANEIHLDTNHPENTMRALDEILINFPKQLTREQRILRKISY